jgi:hypothetical protein
MAAGVAPCDSGNFKPELTSAVVLPEPGGPISTYHGRSYRKSDLPPLATFNVASASFIRSLRMPASSSTLSGVAMPSAMLAVAVLRRFQLKAITDAKAATKTRIVISRTI